MLHKNTMAKLGSFLLAQSLNIKSPVETGKTFYSNSRLKVRYFSKLVNFPVNMIRYSIE